VAAQAVPQVALTVPSGRALRVVLSEDTTVHRVGQLVTAHLVEPVYAYDRIVLPVGTGVQGRITKLTQPAELSRAQSMASGDFAPHRTVEIRFETVIRDGVPVSIDTIAKNEAPHPTRAVTPSTDVNEDAGTIDRAKAEAKSEVTTVIADAKQHAVDALHVVKSPEKLDLAKEWAINQLPYRPQVLRKGTAYDADPLSSLDLGTAPERPAAPEGTLPPPNAVLKARLQTTLDSGTAARGSTLEAIVSEPVFAEDGRLIFPEGTKLTGEV